MNKIFICLIFIFLFPFFADSQEFSSCKKGLNQNFFQQQLSHSGSNNIDVFYYQLFLQVDPTIKYIQGKVAIHFYSKKNKLTELSLDLSDSLRIDSIHFRNKTVSYSRTEANVFKVYLGDSLNLHDSASLSIYYQGIPRSDGFGGFVQNSYNGTDSIIWTLSQPYSSNNWWPCKEEPKDKADSISLSFLCPDSIKVASIGNLEKIDSIGTNVIYHWKTKYPTANYLVAFAACNYEVFETKLPLSNDSLKYQYFLYPNDTISKSQSLKVTPVFMHFFDSIFGQYPFIKEKYGHASFTFGGGMEHQTMSFMGSYGGELIAHELAHQWFGDKISCSSWQDIWLNEGFATYLTGLTYEFGILHDPLYYPQVLKNYKQVSYNHPHSSVFRKDTSHVDSIFNQVSYIKGAATLHMLRWLLGDQAFFDGIRNYVNDSALAYSYAKTEDLKKHFESASQHNLDEFFKDWFYGKGYPTYTLKWSKVNQELRMKLYQTQSDPSVYFFDLPIPFQILGPTVDTTIILNGNYSGHEFRIPFTHQIDSIHFDPESWISADADIVTGLTSNPDEADQVEIYPNPGNNFIELNNPSQIPIKSISIFDASSKLLLKKQAVRIVISDLPNGIYFVQIETENKIIRRKFTVLH